AEICQELNRWRRLYDPAYYVDLPPHILLVAASRSLHRERIEQRLAALCAAFPAFEIELAGVGLHEDEHRLICQIGAGSRQLALLRDQLAALEHPPLRIARRRCWPGITLAKLRRQRSLREAHASVCAGFAPGAWTAEGLVLFEERFGAAWHSVRVFPFAVRPSP
ncbi:MAG TPA: 2'-5' RNA ligase family protein, partial [Herpetosiphonaceae bacterium]